MDEWIESIRWNSEGLIPAIAQEWGSREVLMLAWMNREALQLTVQHQRAVYWSRSRKRLWFKGEESGHIQQLREIRLDCDNDVVLLYVEQVGGIACHTGHQSCFYRCFREGQWVTVAPMLKEPAMIYKEKKIK